MSLGDKKRVVSIIPGCIVCKTCEFHAPDIFIVREKALKAEVLIPEPAPERLGDLVEAIRKCPEHVITFKPVKGDSPAD